MARQIASLARSNQTTHSSQALALRDARALPKLLERLHDATPPTGRVLSVYLDTSPQRTEGQAYLLFYRDGCKALRKDLSPEEAPLFEAAAAQVERYLLEELTPGRPGVAVFASGSPEYFFAAPLPYRPVESVTWGERPEVEALQAAVDEYERVAVLLFDKERARLLTVYLGEIEERVMLVDEVPGKHAAGGWYGLAQARYARHHENHVLRHARRTIRALMELLRRRPFDRLLLAGPDEALSVLRQHLPRPLQARVAGTFDLELFASEAEVLEVARQEAEAAERRAEREAVRRLLEAATSANVALGVDDTLAALSERRVHVLLVADGLTAAGAECRTCERVWSGGTECPICAAPLAPVPDLAERAIQLALEQGARVELVRGEASGLLLERGGLGAWTRY